MLILVNANNPHFEAASVPEDPSFPFKVEKK